ncbi:hypothetical protein PAXRUDRAFT_16448 [Paxillus rubicundulus Ve08.2h10]|uniref:Uncharacterized protein n=1 Tax=Paxillus rubicundulus Ve08.2h10 TaxID=930991 RepID=A0A0D0D6C6_9AGAM|nr:hypothetical protein PAXRUDRAFT_16448 [Paxillus rubicundulus Ve08.2h10]
MDQDTRPTPPTLLDPPSGEGNNPPPMPPQSSVAMGEVPTPAPLTPTNPSQGDHPFPATTVPVGGPNRTNPPQHSALMSEDPTPTPLTPVNPLQGDHPLPATTVPVGGPSTLPMPPQGSVPMDQDPTPAPLTPVNPPQGDHPLPTTTVPARGPNPPDPPQCSAPMEHNPVLPHQTNSTPSGARPSPARPLPLPLTVEIVEPMVQGIANACIPCLTEFIESQFAIQSDRYLKSGLERSAEDSDGDNEEDNEGGSPLVTRRWKPSSHGKQIICMKLFTVIFGK